MREMRREKFHYPSTTNVKVGLDERCNDPICSIYNVLRDDVDFRALSVIQDVKKYIFRKFKENL